MVSKRGGDHANINSPHIKFETDSLLTEKVSSEPSKCCLDLLSLRFLLLSSSPSCFFLECCDIRAGKWTVWPVSRRI